MSVGLRGVRWNEVSCQVESASGMVKWSGQVQVFTLQFVYMIILY